MLRRAFQRGFELSKMRKQRDPDRLPDPSWRRVYLLCIVLQSLQRDPLYHTSVTPGNAMRIRGSNSFSLFHGNRKREAQRIKAVPKDLPQGRGTRPSFPPRPLRAGCPACPAPPPEPPVPGSPPQPPNGAVSACPPSFLLC